MKLPRLAVETYQFTIIIFLLLLFLGISFYFNMPRTEDPPVFPPGSTIIVVYPGTNPIDMEKLITEPVENILNELDDVDKISSIIDDGVSKTSISFVYGTDPDDKYDAVQRQINSIRQDLPEDIFDLEVKKWTTTDVAVVEIALASETMEFSHLGDIADKLKKQLKKIEGVKKVMLYALPEQEVRISLDLEKLASMDLSIQRVSDAIKSNNAIIPGGTIKISGKKFNVQTSGPYGQLDEIRNTVIHSVDGKVIYLKDVASVEFDYKDSNHFMRYNGTKCILLTVQQKFKYNIFDVADKIRKKVEDFKTRQESDVKIDYVLNQSESVDKRVNGFLNNLFQGIMLVGLCIMLVFGFRSSLLVMISIPSSIIIGIGCVSMSGYGLQQISIGGLVVALGLLVDNSIVVVENIERYLEMGYSRIEAAVQATSEVGWAVVSGTVTTSIAFIPIICMPDRSGEFIKSLPVTVIFTLFASLFIALTITPIIASKIMKVRGKNEGSEKKKKSSISNLSRKVVEGPYRSLLGAALKHRFTVILLSAIILCFSFYIFKYVGVSFFPTAEKPQFLVQINLQEGSNIEKTDQVAREIETIITQVPDLKSYLTSVGKGSPKIYYNFSPKHYKSNYAEIFVQLNTYNTSQFQELLKTLRDRFSDYPGADIVVREFEQGPSSSPPLDVVIKGNKIDVLKKLSDEVESALSSVEGVVNIQNLGGKVRTDIHFDINREKANLLGVPIHEIDQTIRTCIAGTVVSKYRDKEGKEYDIVIRSPIKERYELKDISKIYVKSLLGKSIPLTQVASVKFKMSPGFVSREDLERKASVTAFIEPGYDLDTIAKQVKKKIEIFSWPHGYTWYFGGKLEQRGTSFGSMKSAMIIALFGIFAVLVLQFKSFIQPLIIFSAIPMALVGSIWALFITGYTFSFMAFLGLISLVGIVVNDSIVLVEFINLQREKEKKSIQEAIRYAGEIRFVPIVLTTLTTIGGLIPLTLWGGIMWAAMGWTIIGGLLVSTFLTLILVPVFYSIFIGEKQPDTSRSTPVNTMNAPNS